MRPLSYRNCILALVVANVPGTLSGKPVRQYVWPKANITDDITGFLDGTQIQVDQTGDPSHAATIVAPHSVCVPASQAEVNACTSACRRNDAGQPNLLKTCVTGCSGLQDCSNTCQAYSTASFVTYGFNLTLGLNQTCGSSRNSPFVNGTDLTSLIPDPIYGSCHLTRFLISLSEDITLTELVPGKGVHLNIKAEADDPTMRCGAGLQNPTWHHSNFDLYFDPSVSGHHVAWAASSSFNVDVSWWADWLYDITHKVKTVVNGFMATALTNPTLALDVSEALTVLLARDLKAFTGDDVDDFVSIVVTNATAITVTYTPVCVDGDTTCGCSTSCNGLHFCDPKYWNATAPASTCPAGQNCLASGDCCTPSCVPGGCGSDGCGGSCGTCAAGQMCSGKVCKACPEDDCNHICRPNACGDWCGTCKPGSFCADGGCQSSRPNPPGKPPRALLASG